jgi:transcription elongation factor Elf1
MSNIIPIPKVKSAQSRKSNWQVEQIPATHTQAPQQFDFTCAQCQNKTHIQLTNAVLKHMEVFCDKCGTGWKVSNPKMSTKKQKGV